MKKRIISASIIILIFIISLCVNKIFFTLLMTLCGILALKELLKLHNIESLSLLNLLSYLNLIVIILSNNIIKINTTYPIILTILISLMLLVFYNDNKKYNINNALYVMGCIILLGLSFNNIINFRITSVSLCIYIFLLSSITDTFAYIGGSLIGKHKLTEISPKKTWEGSIVGTVMGSIFSIMYYITVVNNLPLIPVIIMSILLTILSQIGDLVFSDIKRYFNIKDYSNIIPGHGGILDRFDSIIFVSLGLTLILELL